jgi:hypothetical protein
MQKTLIFICGWPFSGKSLLATHVKDALNVHHVDIDEVRWLAIGPPHPHPNSNPELAQRDRQEMGEAYRLLFSIINWHLDQERSILATATLSRKHGGQTELERLWKQHDRNVRLRIIQCVPENDTLEVVTEMMEKRSFGTPGGYKGAVNSPERYFEVKERYQPIELLHLKVRTWGSSQSIEDEVRAALEYIQNTQSYDSR